MAGKGGIPLSRIVKSVSVVDDRRQGQEYAQLYLEAQAARLVSRKVLKGGVLDGCGIPLPDMAPATKDAYLEELNRVRVKLDEAKAELRAVRGEIRDATEEYRRFMESREDKDLLEDEIYNRRKREIEELELQARQQSETVLAEATREAGKVSQRARGEGYHDGYAGGYQAAEQAFFEEARPRLEELAELITAISSYGEVLMQEKENEFVELAVAIAEKVLAREIRTDPKYILDMLHEILLKNQRETYINLSLSPDMMSAKAKANDAILEKLREAAPGLSVYLEKEAGEGHLVMETPKGVTDMSLDTQLENIKETLLTDETVLT